MVDKNKIEEAVRMYLEAIGEDITREGLIETPSRVAKASEELFSGINNSSTTEELKSFNIEENNIVIQKGISFYSQCEHHLLPFYGTIKIAYIPNGKVLGLSKLDRLIEIYARRLQLQERLTSQIAENLFEIIDCQGVMVIIEAEHMCMSMRGIKKDNIKTTTLATRGILKEDKELQKEVLKLLA